MRSKGTHGAGLSAATGYYGSISDERELGYREWRERWDAKLRRFPLWMIRARYINYVKSWRAQHEH